MIFAGICVKKGGCSFCVASTKDALIFFTYGPTGVLYALKNIYPKSIKNVLFDADEMMDYVGQRNNELEEEYKLFPGYKFVSMHNDDVAAVVEMIKNSRVECVEVGGQLDQGAYTD